MVSQEDNQVDQVPTFSGRMRDWNDFYSEFYAFLTRMDVAEAIEKDFESQLPRQNSPSVEFLSTFGQDILEQEKSFQEALRKNELAMNYALQAIEDSPCSEGKIIEAIEASRVNGWYNGKACILFENLRMRFDLTATLSGIGNIYRELDDIKTVKTKDPIEICERIESLKGSYGCISDLLLDDGTIVSHLNKVGVEHFEKVFLDANNSNAVNKYIEYKDLIEEMSSVWRKRNARRRNRNRKRRKARTRRRQVSDLQKYFIE